MPYDIHKANYGIVFDESDTVEQQQQREREKENQGVTEWALSLSLRQTPGYINFEIGRSKCRCYHILLSQ